MAEYEEVVVGGITHELSRDHFHRIKRKCRRRRGGIAYKLDERVDFGSIPVGPRYTAHIVALPGDERASHNPQEGRFFICPVMNEHLYILIRYLGCCEPSNTSPRLYHDMIMIEREHVQLYTAPKRYFLEHMMFTNSTRCSLLSAHLPPYPKWWMMKKLGHCCQLGLRQTFLKRDCISYPVHTLFCHWSGIE